MTRPVIAPVSYDYDGAAIATGYSRELIVRAVQRGDLPTRRVVVDGRAVRKPVILAADLREWVETGSQDRATQGRSA